MGRDLDDDEDDDAEDAAVLVGLSDPTLEARDAASWLLLLLLLWLAVRLDIEDVAPVARDLRRPLPRPRPYVEDPNPSFIHASSSLWGALGVDGEEEESGADVDELESFEVLVPVW